MPKKGAIIVALFAAGLIAALVFTSFGNTKFRCEICISYHGHRACRIAAARTREGAQRAASELACTEMEQSMADRVNCPNTPPDSVKWLEQ